MPKTAGRLSLRERIIKRLNEALFDVIRHANKESRGSDGVTIRQFAAQWKQEKKKIIDELKSGAYRFQPLRGVILPKDSSKPLTDKNARPISVPAVRDRIVQRAMLAVLWPQIRDQVFTEWSFGGIREYKVRKGATAPRLTTARKSVRLAVERVLQLRGRGLSWVFESDIKNFFPSINKELLIARLAEHLQDESIAELIHGAVSTEIGNAAKLGEYAKFWDPDRGVPQGGILSPVFANFYLNPFDQALADAGFALVRYVDDFVVLAPSEDDAHRAYGVALHELGLLGLSVYKLGESDAKGRFKTRIVEPGKEFDFLGATFHKNAVIPKRSKWEDLDARIIAATDSRGRPPEPLIEIVRRTNAIVRGWLSAFSFCNISRIRLEELDLRVRDRVGGWLHANGISKDKNVLDPRRARLVGLRSATEVEISPLLR